MWDTDWYTFLVPLPPSFLKWHEWWRLHALKQRRWLPCWCRTAGTDVYDDQLPDEAEPQDLQHHPWGMRQQVLSVGQS
jgi:hypothetical protein